MIVKCTKCHHEWQAVGGYVLLDGRRVGKRGPLDVLEIEICDWCGAPGEKTADDWEKEEG